VCRRRHGHGDGGRGALTDRRNACAARGSRRITD
jgi:hypothetical protein